MALDSSAVFLERIVAIGLSPLAAQFEALGWNTHGTFAYAASAPPGSAGGADAFSAEIAGPLLGADYGVHQDLAKIRRLHFESYTLAVADMNRMVNKTEDDDKPRTLPAPERALRMAALQEIRRQRGAGGQSHRQVRRHPGKGDHALGPLGRVRKEVRRGIGHQA